eukprot:c23331_g1_i3 orf=100-279(-)
MEGTGDHKSVGPSSTKHVKKRANSCSFSDKLPFQFVIAMSILLNLLQHQDILDLSHSHC